MNKKAIIIISLVLAVSAIIYFTGAKVPISKQVAWQNQAAPGKLSAAHKGLTGNCASCHTATKGAEDAKCINCHSMNTALLQRKPTAFHAIIGNCASCHKEHLGEGANMRVMDHEAFARISTSMILRGKNNNSDVVNNPVLTADYPLVSPLVARLNCATCHSTKDRHQGLFGTNCASCHSATQWTILAFQHPTVRSTDCAQCHQAPPSHYMMHFEMIDKKTAARDNLEGDGCCDGVVVNQCYKCHKTTSFNDIKGVGYYKHH